MVSKSNVPLFLFFLFFLTDEPGVFIGKITQNNPTRAFLGYVDQSASEKKIVRDVFVKGDSAFLSGMCKIFFIMQSYKYEISKDAKLQVY